MRASSFTNLCGTELHFVQCKKTNTRKKLAQENMSPVQIDLCKFSVQVYWAWVRGITYCH